MLKLSLPDNDLEPDLEFECAWPPSINHYYGNGILLPKLEEIIARHAEHGFSGFWKWLRGRCRVTTFIKERGKVYREALAWQLVRQRGKFGSADVVIELELHPPTAFKPDVGNFNKALFDAIEHAGVIDNDRQIAQLLETRCAPTPRGSVVVRLWRSRAA